MQHIAFDIPGALALTTVQTSPHQSMEQVTVAIYSGAVGKGLPATELVAIHQFPEMPDYEAAELVEAIARRHVAECQAAGEAITRDERPAGPGPARAIVGYSDRRRNLSLTLVIYRVVAAVNYPARYLSVQPN